MDLQQDLLPIMRVTHKAQQLSQVNMHCFENSASEHFAFMKIHAVVPGVIQSYVCSLEPILCRSNITATLEAPVAHESWTDNFVHRNHFSSDFLNFSVLCDFDRFCYFFLVLLICGLSERRQEVLLSGLVRVILQVLIGELFEYF